VTTPLYQEIAESLRQAIYYGKLKPGDELPPVRGMSTQWNCAPGTVQRAYRELARQGLVTSRPGQGTRVSAPTTYEQPDPLRRAALANEAEVFLLRFLSSGYSVGEIEQAVQLALDRWRAISSQDREPVSEDIIRFVGSHDPLMVKIADWFGTLSPRHTMQISFAGSLGGLIALAERKADIAGCHLWDEETDTYNMPFVQRLLPGRRTALLTLAHRRLGLMLAPGNPLGVEGLSDLVSPHVRFINRQPGAGTRVWLDAQLYRSGINVDQITGYDKQVMTHTEVAHAILEGYADVGLGIETAAQTYGLDFLFLTNERYDLVVPESMWASEPIQCLVRWLSSDENQLLFDDVVGYGNQETGRVRWSDPAAAGGA
jgi:molybdate-binding protein/DNA-binding transcriptional regulator YhcF (GntR family)